MVNHFFLTYHRLILLILIVVLWLVFLWIKMFNPVEFREIILRPPVYYHRYRAKGFRVWTVQKLAAHFLWLVWMAVYLLVSYNAFPDIRVNQAIYLFAGWYVAIILFLRIAEKVRPYWKGVYFLTFSYILYASFWLGLLTFVIVFLWVPHFWVWVLISVAMLIIALEFDYNLLKITGLELGIRRLYIILYLCALEILPVLVIISYLI